MSDTLTGDMTQRWRSLPATPETATPQPTPLGGGAEPPSVVVEARDLWKVFGPDPEAAIEAVRSGMSRPEVDRRFGCIVAVAGVDFQIARGEVFCVMGLSGSGKSTLVRHINRLVEPTRGALFVEGVDVNALDEARLRRLRSEKIGMVFQNMGLFPHWSVVDNVAFGLEVKGLPKRERRERARAWLERVELSGWASRYPHELSGGMKQRVGLARALCTDPDVLLMDEPFSALDPLIRRQLQDEFIDLSARYDKTTLFITHDLDEAVRLGDRIAIMREGRFVQVGTPEEIVTKPADDYVASFVKGISRLKLIRAHSVMQPLGPFEKENPDVDISGLRFVSANADLEELIGLAAQLEPVVVVDGDGRSVGIITVFDLLKGIGGAKGANETETNREYGSL